MKTIFQLRDKLTGDAFAIEHDRKGDRLLITSAIDNEGSRCMVLVSARRVGMQLADALREALGDAPAPRPRTAKTLRKVELR